MQAPCLNGGRALIHGIPVHVRGTPGMPFYSFAYFHARHMSGSNARNTGYQTETARRKQAGFDKTPPPNSANRCNQHGAPVITFSQL
jgi:hypothetical protein